MTQEQITTGHDEIINDVMCDDMEHDPWGTTMHYLTQIAVLVRVRTGEILPDFEPGPSYPQGAELDPEEWEVALEWERRISEGRMTYADLHKAYDTLSDMADEAEAAGRSY